MGGPGRKPLHPGPAVNLNPLIGEINMQKESTFTLALRATFGDAPLTAITYKGQPAWVGLEVGRALGMADPRKAARVVTEDDDCEEGIDYVTVAGADLEAVKALDWALNERPVDDRAPSLTLLLEPGLWRTVASARTAGGKAFRHWLYREHLPALRRKPAAPIATRPATLTERGAVARAYGGALLRELADLSDALVIVDRQAEKRRAIEDRKAARRAATEARAAARAEVRRLARAAKHERYVRAWLAKNGEN